MCGTEGVGVCVMVGLFFEVGSSGGEILSRSPEAGPPQPAAVEFGSRAALGGGFAAQVSTALVLAFPVVGAVFFPVFTEFGGEGFGEQEELDVVAASGEVFFDEATGRGDAAAVGGFFVAGRDCGEVAVGVLVAAAVLA
jgi:hypothetical protein